MGSSLSWTCTSSKLFSAPVVDRPFFDFFIERRVQPRPQLALELSFPLFQVPDIRHPTFFLLKRPHFVQKPPNAPTGPPLTVSTSKVSKSINTRPTHVSNDRLTPLTAPLIMLTSPYTRPSATDHSFFSSSKISKPVASSSVSVVVTTRYAHVPASQVSQKFATIPNRHIDQPRTATPPTGNVSGQSKKRKQHPALPRSVKRLRTAERPHKSSSSASSSRASSRQNTLAPSPEPIYRSSRSRSVSTFHNAEAPLSRPCWIEEDGTPGPSFLSAEIVVRDLMKTYKGCRSF
jgi:hypothetical protein